MREMKANASGVASKPIERCFTHLSEIERYPQWYPEVVRRVTVLERGADGRARRVDAMLSASAGPLHRDFQVRMELTTLRPTLVALSRVADDRGDHEALSIEWKLAAAGEAATEIQLEMTAYLDVPRFLPVGQITDEIANGFRDAALKSLA